MQGYLLYNSDCLLYGLVIESGFNGLVCENNPVAWFKAISRLIENPSLRRSLIDNAQFHIYDNFSIGEEFLPDL